jgi:hypothetical protein
MLMTKASTAPVLETTEFGPETLKPLNCAMATPMGIATRNLSEYQFRSLLDRSARR